MNQQLLPTTVVGSYPVPEWMERLKTDCLRGRISLTQLDDIHEMAIKAALRDQERVGIDIVSDGELRRDNDIDYFLARLPGIQIGDRPKDFYFDYFDATLTTPLPPRSGDELSWLADDYAFTATQTDKPIKFSFTGPFSLSSRVRTPTGVGRRELMIDVAHRLNDAAHALADKGATLLQIDEPFLAGYPDQVENTIAAINIVTSGVAVDWALHVCYGNRYARPSWEGHYDFLFPAVLGANVDQLVLEFARKGYADLPVIEKFGWDRKIGLGVIDVKSQQVETPELVTTRIRAALDLVAAEQLVINPDCGLRNMSADVARAKLAAMVQGTAHARNSLRPRAAAEAVVTPDPVTQGA